MKIACVGIRHGKDVYGFEGKGKHMSIWKDWTREVLFLLHKQNPNHILLIPISSIFDLECLSIAEKLNMKVELHLPDKNWGHKLAAHHKQLIMRMHQSPNCTTLITPGINERMVAMLKEAEGVLWLDDGRDNYGAIIRKKKAVLLFPWQDYLAHIPSFTQQEVLS